MLFDSILHDSVRTLAGLLVGLALFRGIELIFPQRDCPAPERNLLGLRIWLVYVGVQIVLTGAILAVMDSSAEMAQVDPGLLWGLPPWVSAIVVGLAVVLTKDFLFYWEHRIQHRWLWRWHAPHHAIRNLSATNSWHHWSEILMFAVLVSLPLSLLSPAFGPRPFILGLLLSWQPIYLHSSTRLDLPAWLRRIVVDNRYHRIHHSLEPRHFERNFGAATPLWDWLFGTLHMPEKQEWPDVGLAGVDEPATVGEWSDLPWRLKPAAIEPDDALKTA